MFFLQIFLTQKCEKCMGSAYIYYISQRFQFPFQSYYTGLLIYHIGRSHIYPFINSPVNLSYAILIASQKELTGKEEIPSPPRTVVILGGSDGKEFACNAGDLG